MELMNFKTKIEINPKKRIIIKEDSINLRGLEIPSYLLLSAMPIVEEKKIVIKLKTSINDISIFLDELNRDEFEEDFQALKKFISRKQKIIN